MNASRITKKKKKKTGGSSNSKIIDCHTPGRGGRVPIHTPWRLCRPWGRVPRFWLSASPPLQASTLVSFPGIMAGVPPFPEPKVGYTQAPLLRSNL